MSILTAEENRLVRELWKIRDAAHKAHKWTPKQKARAQRIDDWLKADEQEIQRRARKPKLRGGGWSRHHRAGRFQIIHATRLKHKAGRPEVWAQTGSLQERAYKVAKSLVGIMEHGGNNQGASVMRIIRENGGMGPEPWCGDFTAFCYRHAGSKSVSRAWAMAWYLEGRITGRPKRGDIVDYTFQHTGIYVRDLGGGQIECIEGNTGASGAVSDSATGGDGVYSKKRSKSLVKRYVRVLR